LVDSGINTRWPIDVLHIRDQWEKGLGGWMAELR
jgi:hypothetical protein